MNGGLLKLLRARKDTKVTKPLLGVNKGRHIEYSSGGSIHFCTNFDVEFIKRFHNALSMLGYENAKAHVFFLREMKSKSECRIRSAIHMDCSEKNPETLAELMKRWE